MKTKEIEGLLDEAESYWPDPTELPDALDTTMEERGYASILEAATRGTPDGAERLAELAVYSRGLARRLAFALRRAVAEGRAAGPATPKDDDGNR